MKECVRITDLFGKLHDDEADGEIGDLVRDHLYNCPGCREEYKWYSLTVQALGSLETASPPENFVAQLSSRIYSEPSSGSLGNFFRNIFTYSPYMPLPVGVASLFLIAVIGLVVYNSPFMPVGTAAQVATQAPAPHTGILTVGKPGGIVATHSGPSIPVTTSPSLPNSHPRSANPERTVESRPQFPTIADLIGADNLTVESPSVDKALESLKQILPGIQGRLVEKRDGNPGDVVLAVLIPSDSYGHLTTELIKHGAVAVGAGTQDNRLSPAQKDGNNVLLYIRFVSSH